MNNGIRETDDLLEDSELETVVGGALDNCTRLPTPVMGPVMDTSWTFKDVFAKYTL
jgi:hypothetical protein